MLYIVKKNPVYLIGLLCMFLSDNLNRPEKMFFEKVVGRDQMFLRPNPPPEGCCVLDYLCENKPTTYGFPSGHAQTAFFFAMFMSLYDREHALFYFLYAILSSLNRVRIGCHNLLQVFGGALFGMVYAFISFKLFVKN